MSQDGAVIYGLPLTDTNKAYVAPPCSTLQYLPKDQFGDGTAYPFGLTLACALRFYAKPSGVYLTRAFLQGTTYNDDGSLAFTYGGNVTGIPGPRRRKTIDGVPTTQNPVYQWQLACPHDMPFDRDFDFSYDKPGEGGIATFRLQFDGPGIIALDELWEGQEIQTIPDSARAFHPRLQATWSPNPAPGASGCATAITPGPDIVDCGSLTIDFTSPNGEGPQISIPFRRTFVDPPVSQVDNCIMSFTHVTFAGSD